MHSRGWWWWWLDFGVGLAVHGQRDLEGGYGSDAAALAGFGGGKGCVPRGSGGLGFRYHAARGKWQREIKERHGGMGWPVPSNRQLWLGYLAT